MMTTDQIKTVTQVYTRFMESEVPNQWDALDDLLSLLESLTDKEIYVEAEIVRKKHIKGAISCKSIHAVGSEDCLAPKISEAGQAICELYAETGELHKNNRYILSYFIALDQVGMFVVTPTESGSESPSK